MVGTSDPVVSVTRMYGLTPELVRGCILQNRRYVVPTNVGAFVLITVIDMTLIRIGDFGDLTDADRRLRASNVGSGIIPSIFDGIDIPVRVVTYMSIVPLEIGVIREHFVMRFAFPILSARPVAVVANTWHEVSVSEGSSE